MHGPVSGRGPYIHDCGLCRTWRLTQVLAFSRPCGWRAVCSAGANHLAAAWGAVIKVEVRNQKGDSVLDIKGTHGVIGPGGLNGVGGSPRWR